MRQTTDRRERAPLAFMAFREDEPYKVARIENGEAPLVIYAYAEDDPEQYGVATVRLACGSIAGFEYMTPEQAEAIAEGLIRAAAVARGGERKPPFEYKSKRKFRTRHAAGPVMRPNHNRPAGKP